MEAVPSEHATLPTDDPRTAKRPMLVLDDGRNVFFVFVLLILLFALWGFCNGMIDVMDKHFQEELQGLPTGSVIATVDAKGNATYELVQPAAWDEIIVSDKALEAVAKSRALTFGSLAGRSLYNLEQLARLLAVNGPLKFFDVNLRPPFVDPPMVMKLARRADVLKLNDGEVGRLASWLRTGEATPNTPRNPEAIAEACAVLTEATNASRICVTLAEEGAAFWDRGTLVTAPAPKVVVKDTVGAGDAFMAGLMVGLTRGTDTRKILENACRLGAYVALHHGATPLLPPEMKSLFPD
jgi:fructokinase